MAENTTIDNDGANNTAESELTDRPGTEFGTNVTENRSTTPESLFTETPQQHDSAVNHVNHKTSKEISNTVRETSAKTAKTVSSAVVKGFAALREVNQAKRRHVMARQHLDKLQRELEASTELLDHRIDVEENYETIVTAQQAEINEAQATLDEAKGDYEATENSKQACQEQLTKMKAEHEQHLEPYEHLTAAAKERLEDANRNLTEAKRILKATKSQLHDVCARRDARLTTAHRSIDNAEARCHRLQEELTRMQQDPTHTSHELTAIQQEIDGEFASIASSKEEISTITTEAKQVVDNAQTHLWTQERSTEIALRRAHDAKAEYLKHKETYLNMLNEMRAEEAHLENELVAYDKKLRDIDQLSTKSQNRIDAAHLVIDDANDIKATPEETDKIKWHIRDTQSAIEVQQHQVDLLAEYEVQVRSRTRQQRLVFIGMVVGVIVIIIAVFVILNLKR